MIMKREMRRFRQLLPQEDAKRILHDQTNGVLSLVDSDGKPYGVPLSFAYDGKNAIYFHSATKGRKADCIGDGCYCSFCVVGRDEIIAEKFTSFFQSVIVGGHIRIVTDTDEIMKGLLLLCEKYSPGIDSRDEIARYLSHVLILRLDIEEMTGKEAIELVRKRGGEKA